MPRPLTAGVAIKSPYCAGMERMIAAQEARHERDGQHQMAWAGCPSGSGDADGYFAACADGAFNAERACLDA